MLLIFFSPSPKNQYLYNHSKEFHKYNDNLNLIRKIKECNINPEISQEQIIETLKKFKALYEKAVDKVNQELNKQRKEREQNKYRLNI